MSNIIKIVMLCYLYLNIDMVQAIGCNQKSSQCIRYNRVNSTIQGFQKMFCPIQKRFTQCWDMCTENEKSLHYAKFLKLRVSIHLCDEKIETSTNVTVGLDVAKCVTKTLYRDYLMCSDRIYASYNRSPTNNMVPNQGFINALTVKYCVNSNLVEKTCGSDAYTLIERMKRVILPTMNEYDMVIV